MILLRRFMMIVACVEDTFNGDVMDALGGLDFLDLHHMSRNISFFTIFKLEDRLRFFI